MDIKDFRKYAHEVADWMADYFENVHTYPVKPSVKPGEIKDQIPYLPPQQGESMSQIMNDLNDKIIPGMTHWQSPNFFGYFNANNSGPSVIAEMITASMGAQCMVWLTSPAATELEERMMEWLQQIMGIPDGFTGVIQDTASTATLVSLLTAREKKSSYRINQEGFLSQKEKFIIYSSAEVHSSIDKAVKIAGFGIDNLRKIPVDESFAMIPNLLESAINKDLQDGNIPLAVISALGTTGSTAIDPIRTIGEICKKFDLWHHVDAAFAGTALILPEKRWMADGLEMADTYVFNPHKWMFVNFDCSVYFVKDTEALKKTFSITPEYLKTAQDDQVSNFRDWGIQLGRRFRALKLWFVIRNYGVNGLQEKIREHLELTEWFKKELENATDFEILAPVPLNTICFRYHPLRINDPEKLNMLNQKLIEKLNNTGKLFLTHTKLNGHFTLRIVIGQTNVEQSHVEDAWNLIQSKARSMELGD